MVLPDRHPKNAINSFAQRIYNPLGFKRVYNFILWFTFAGGLFGFILARFMYLNFSANFCPPGGSRGANNALPGECYYYETFSKYKVGILLHLATILPAGLLVILQFTPAVRHRWILFHRINGYVVLVLFVVSTVGVLMISRHSFGGGLDTQSASGVLSIMCIGSFTMAYINIKCLQIEQHRAWMLRGWFYAGCIITSRPILFISTLIISAQQNYYTVRPCAQLYFTHQQNTSKTLSLYPSCEGYFNGSNLQQEAMVHGDFGSDDINEVGAALGMTFGMAIWVALWLHAVGIEIYLHLTPRETERLRRVSYQRQLEAGMKRPGSAGLTADRLGDAELWIYCEHDIKKENSGVKDRDVQHREHP